MSSNERMSENSVLGYELLARVITRTLKYEEAHSLIRHKRAKTPHTKKAYSEKLHEALGPDDPISKALKDIEGASPDE